MPATAAKYRRCSVEGCDKRHLARGYCSAHYERSRRKHGGSVLTTQRGWRPPEPVLDRVMRRTMVDTDGCWTYTGPLSRTGYAMIWTGSRRDGSLRQRPVHRVVYEEIKGVVSPDLELDHLCYNRACCNPDHLEPVTPSVNVRRAVAWNGASA